MSDHGSTANSLRYAVKTARRAGLIRDLPCGPEDLQWVANSATLLYGTDDAVLVDTFTSIEQNDELVDWMRSFDRILTCIYITHGHGDQKPDRPDDPAILSETAAYLRDFNRLAASSSTPEELYGAMLELHPRRANPGSLWGGAKHAKAEALVG